MIIYICCCNYIEEMMIIKKKLTTRCDIRICMYMILLLLLYTRVRAAVALKRIYIDRARTGFVTRYIRYNATRIYLYIFVELLYIYTIINTRCTTYDVRASRDLRRHAENRYNTTIISYIVYTTYRVCGIKPTRWWRFSRERDLFPHNIIIITTKII